MSAKIRMKIGEAWVEVDAATAMDAVKLISPYYELLGQRECGVCGSPNVGLNHRVSGGYDFYGVKCFSCGARLDFGQQRDGGGLFPKRKLPSGEYDKEHQGWYRWQDRKDREGSSSGEF